MRKPLSVSNDNQAMANDIGKLVLRITLGILILLHGIAKVTHGTTSVEKMLESVGLPSAFALGVYVGEVLAPLLLLIGFYARIGAALIVVNMLFAIGLAHRDELFLLGKTGGWALELQALFLFTALALAIMGPGRFGINRT